MYCPPKEYWKSMWEGVCECSPHKVIRWFKLYCEFQRKGYSEADTYSLDNCLGNLILERLKLFDKLKCGYPASMKEEEWDNIITEMIEGFELLANNDDLPMEESPGTNLHDMRSWLKEDYWERNGFDSTKYEENTRKVDKSFKLFQKYFYSLWW